ncbi:MAG: argininosuccinate synthase [Planctomycetota bacterium]
MGWRETWEQKIVPAPVPAVKKVALAFSGGLDSSLCIELLRRKYKVNEIVAVMADVGQGADEIKEGMEKAKVLKVKPILIDVKKEFTENWLTKAIRANSDYEGYPVSTSMTRQLIAREVGKMASKLGCDAVMEGSTGKGNDQYRFHNTFKVFAPECIVLCPVRDFNMMRSEERELCEHWGIPVTEQIAGGDDKTLWCRSIASGSIDLNQKLPKDIWMWLVVPEKAKNKAEVVSLTFEQGLPTKLNGKVLPLDKLVDSLNIIAGRNGIGLIDMFEDGIMSLKSRELYEAPAAQVILKVHADIEGQCLTKEEREFKKIVDAKWAYMTYHAEWFHPLHAALDAFIETTQAVVNGTVSVKLYKGSMEIVERDAPSSSLFSPEMRSIKRAGFDQRWSTDAAKIRGIPYELIGKRIRLMKKGK